MNPQMYFEIIKMSKMYCLYSRCQFIIYIIVNINDTKYKHVGIIILLYIMPRNTMEKNTK